MQRSISETLQSSFVDSIITPGLSLCLGNTNPYCLSNLTQSLLDVRCTERRLEILLVGEDQERDVLVVLILHRPPELHLGLVQLVGLGAVHHEDNPVRAPVANQRSVFWSRDLTGPIRGQHYLV